MRRQTALPSFALLIGLTTVAAIGILVYVHLSSLDDRARWVWHTHEVLETADAVTAEIGDAISARRAYALTGDDASLGLYRTAIAQAGTARARLRELTSDDPRQLELLDRLESVVGARLARLDDAIEQRRTLGFDAEREATVTANGHALSSRLRELLSELQDRERRLLAERQDAFQEKSATVKRIMLLGFVASGVLLCFAFVQLRREASRRARSEAALAERERRLAITLDSIGDGVIATDAAGAITHQNPVAEQMTGWSAAEAAGRPFADVVRIIGETTRAPIHDPIARVLAERVEIGLADDSLLAARDGTERPIASNAAPMLDERGQLQGVVIVIRDMTATRASETRFRQLIEGAPDGILVAGADGRIAIVNNQANLLFGYAAGELIDQSIEVLLPEHLRERHAGHRRAYHAAPAMRTMGATLPLIARRKDGSAFPVEVSLGPFHSPDGPQVFASVRDVSSRRELERFRDEYVGYISHDLKNPLSIIMLQAQLLEHQLDQRASEAEKRSLRTIAANASSIDRMVRELLEMAYVESPQIEIHPEPVALAPFLQSVVDRTVSTADRARIRVEILQPSTAAIEERRLERVVVNFLQNALKYAPPGTPIRVRLETKDDRAVVSVTDGGPGIAPEDQAFVFDKYKRAASARTTEGLGLGLYISRKIIEAHGGDIGVESAPGRGATFFFRLPRVADRPGPEPSPLGPAVLSKITRLAGVKLLLVDDEVNAVSALTELLGDEGLDVTSATSGERALLLAQANRPDVVVLDVQMPGMSGLALLERLRERYPGLPAVIMTGHMAHQAGIAEVRESGAAYVGKPVDVDALLRTIGRVIPARPAS